MELPIGKIFIVFKGVLIIDLVNLDLKSGGIVQLSLLMVHYQSKMVVLSNFSL